MLSQYNTSIIIAGCSILFFGIVCCQDPSAQSYSISSPDTNIQVDIFSLSGGEIAYQVRYRGETVVDTSTISFVFDDSDTIGDASRVVDAQESTFDQNWTSTWGEQRVIRNHYNEIKIDLVDRQGQVKHWSLTFRAYDDGIGFRTSFPDIPPNQDVVIQEELSQFKMTGNHRSWWIPADYDSYEYLYNQTAISEIDTTGRTINLPANTVFERHAVNTPVTMETSDEIYLSIHEAALINYAGMTLRLEDDKRTFTSSLVPNREGVKVMLQGAFSTPWRTIQIAQSPGQLIESHLIENLNEPNAINNTSWIRPGKYIGIWWSHHIGATSWAPGTKQGATTENAKRHIDFAARYFFPYVLIEGWNQGWEYWFNGPRKEDAFSFTEAAPDFDLEEVARYAALRGVNLMLHHETNSVIPNYEEQLEAAIELLNTYNVPIVKTGYVGKVVPEGEYHHGQFMVNHYNKVMEDMADNQIMVVVHEPIKPTGLRRTYPNLMGAEGLRGSEFNSPGGGGNPPSHLTIVPFTRMLAGPIDYTPGLVQLQLDNYQSGYQVPTTLAYQLATYIVLDGPIQMASDMIEHYENHNALQFIMDLTTDWEQSKVLDGAIGEFIVMARQIRERRTWFIGAITNDDPRNIDIILDFLEANQHYMATIYADGEKADFINNNMDYTMSRQIVMKDDVISLALARGGGAALRVVPVERAPRSN